VRILLFLLALLGPALPAPVAPAMAADNPATYVQARLLSQAAAARPGESVVLGLHMKIHPGWHTYWRNPGDSGIPTMLAWTLPEGYAAGEIEWPVPERQPVGPLMNYGYSNEVTLPVRLTVPAGAMPGSVARIGVHATWLVCEKICIPEEATLSLDLPIAAAGRADPAHAALFRATLDALPKPSPWPATFKEAGKRIDLLLAAPDLTQGRLIDAYFFPYSETALEHVTPQPFEAGAEGLRLALTRGIGAGPEERFEGLLVLEERIDGGGARHAFVVEAARVAGAPAAAPALAAAGGTGADGGAAEGQPGLLLALGLALLGGMVLNLMPCVFPVLSIKAIGLVEHAQGDRRTLRLSGLAYTAGVLASFAIVAGLLLGFRAGGSDLGWGFQLQHPAFVAVLAYVMFAVGLNLAGLFSFGPAIGLGQGLAARGGHMGSFFTGALATIVATPCTAPFMVTAMGFALAAPWPVAVLVFQALGLGLALPYLALTFLPGLARLLPRPGAWMETFRQALAFPMFGAAAWLVWVLSQQTGPDGLAAVLAGMVLLGFAAWAWGRGGIVVKVSAGLALAAALVLAVREPSLPAPATAATSAEFEAFSPARLDAARAAGKPVFVNMTAAWCITCLVNERVALSSEGGRKLFQDKGIVYLKGDWTNRDPEITRFLSAHGRNGVPLYVYYPPRGGPVVLDQILTEASLRESLRP